MPAHVCDPASTLLVISKGEAIKALADRFNPGKAQHAALEAAYPVCAEVPPIKQDRHSHCHDDARRATGEQSFRKMGRTSTARCIFCIFHSKAGPENMFEKSLQQRRHSSVP